MTVSALAESLAVAPPTACRAQSAGDEMSVRTVRRYAEALGVPPAWLAFGTVPAAKPPEES
jgi:hypothetical protein